MNITSICYDYREGKDGPEVTGAEVGKNGVVKIEEHSPRGEGDKWYYDIVYSTGRVIRTFNPNKVVLDEEAHNETL